MAGHGASHASLHTAAGPAPLVGVTSSWRSGRPGPAVGVRFLFSARGPSALSPARGWAGETPTAGPPPATSVLSPGRPRAPRSRSRRESQSPAACVTVTRSPRPARGPAIGTCQGGNGPFCSPDRGVSCQRVSWCEQKGRYDLSPLCRSGQRGNPSLGEDLAGGAAFLTGDSSLEGGEDVISGIN